jgi:heptosyltransferase-2
MDTYRGKITDLAPVIFSSEADIRRVDQWLGNNLVSAENNTIALAPGSVWPTKRWPENYFFELGKILVADDYNVILIGGDADRILCERIAGEKIINAAGSFTIRESAEFLRRCSILISNDSAPMHLAGAVATPVIALFGPTVPAFGFTPHGDKNRILEKKLACRPCGVHGGRTCPIKTHECMQSISPEQVYREICEHTRSH